MAPVEIPTVAFTGQNLAEVQAWLRARDADVIEVGTAGACAVLAYDGDCPLGPGDVIIEDTAGSVFVMPRK